MKYNEFEFIITPNRLHRYEVACSGNKRLARYLYRQNIILAEEMFGVINMFEIALRNAIDHYYSAQYGTDWLKDAIAEGGRLDNGRCGKTKSIISYAFTHKVGEENYTKEALLSECEFGVWRYMFASHPFQAMGSILMDIFPNRPEVVNGKPCNAQYVFEELGKINTMRNRIAHHEPICFHAGQNLKESRQVRYIHYRICTLLQWMGIDSTGLLWGIDHVENECQKLDEI